MQEEISYYQTIIFDLGGVIINLDTNATFRSFLRFNPDLTPEILHHPTAINYELGLISDAQFRDEVRGLVGPGLSDQEIDECWNAMILDIPRWRIELLKKLRDSHTVYLLSNTNNIHIRKVETDVLPSDIPAISHLFDKVYYSHKMNKRKPNKDIYEQVISENDLIPGKTLFIDDNPHNIAGARETGIHAIHLTDPGKLRKIFNA